MKGTIFLPIFLDISMPVIHDLVNFLVSIEMYKNRCENMWKGKALIFISKNFCIFAKLQSILILGQYFKILSTSAA